MKKIFKIILLCVVFFALVSVFVFSVYKINDTVTEYSEGKQVYEEIAENAVETATATVDAETESGREEPVKESPPINVDFDYLRQQNADIVGWIYCEGTPINFPVLQSEDNNYYLRRMVNGQYNISGSIFMDYRCDPHCSDLNTIIYGHNMKNDTMFGTIIKYADQAYYDAHPVLWYLTPDGAYKIELIAGYETKSTSDAYTVFTDAELLASHLEDSAGRSCFVSECDISKSERIVTLSTCSGGSNDMRFVLIGNLIPC